MEPRRKDLKAGHGLTSILLVTIMLISLVPAVSNPVAAERLTPVDLLPQTSVSPDGDAKTKLLIQDEKSNDQRSGTIKAQLLDGRVYIEYDDTPGVEVAEDLSKLNYVWV